MLITASSHKKLLPIPCRVLWVIIVMLTTTITFGQSNSCNAELKVEKDRNIRSTPLDGTYYSMVITNTASSTDTFSLTALNINSTCANTDGSSSADNVNIEGNFFRC